MPRSDGSHISVLHETPCDRPGRLQERMTRLRAVVDFQNAFVDRDGAAEILCEMFTLAVEYLAPVFVAGAYLIEELPISVFTPHNQSFSPEKMVT